MGATCGGEQASTMWIEFKAQRVDGYKPHKNCSNLISCKNSMVTYAAEALNRVSVLNTNYVGA